MSAWPGLHYVQFLDGDCELDSGWLGVARAYLEGHAQAAVACGRRRERAPAASVYNRLCDVEWNTPVGPALACGGDALMRLRALAEVDGFLEQQIAGEEPELCFRLREKGWLIERLPAEMTRHDAAMHSLRQWWRRSQRAGYSYASVHFLRSAPPEWIYRQEVRSILAWSLLLPGLILSLSIFSPYAWLLLLAYPLQVVRLWIQYQGEGSIAPGDRLPYSVNCVAGKFPGLLGLVGFHRDRLLARRGRLIEYK
jgi:GT2 family glycosyltransferase